jgi:hypothetical protein
MALLVMSACMKEKAAITTPCNFDIKIDWVKGSKVQFTVTPENPNAAYAYGLLLADDVLSTWSDSQFIEWQLGWMKDSYEGMEADGVPHSTFQDIYCYKGTRTIRNVLLSSGMDWLLMLFQVNPETQEAIGPLYRVPFSTLPVEMKEMSFEILAQGDRFTIVPSDMERTWFWEYETADKIEEIYGNPYFFYYEIIDMYEQYDFLDNLLCQGVKRWILPSDDPSIKEDVSYTMSLSGCGWDGEITSDVYYVDFIWHQGRVQFTFSDIPIIEDE